MRSATTGQRAGRIVALVSALGAAQSVAIVTQIGATGGAVSDTVFGAVSTARIVLGLLSIVFLTVAVTVTTVVVTGAAETVLTGQIRDIALRRLLGASATDEGRRVARLIGRQALAGLACGAAGGYLVSLVVLEAGFSSSDGLRFTPAALVPSPWLLLALGAQWIATRGAVRRSTRAVLAVSPAQALRVAGDSDLAVPATLGAGSVGAAAALTAGVALLGGALLLSASTPIAMLPAVAGGVLSFVGVVSYGPRFVPVLLGALGRLAPRTFSLTLARRTLLRHQVRTSRAVIGVAGTVALVTTFVVGIASFESSVDDHYRGSAVRGLAHDVVSTVVGVVLVLTAFLAVTATIALGAAVSFNAWLRRRDTALLRVLGQSARQTRARVLAESFLLTATAAVLGLALGICYGWIGAQSLFGIEARGHLVGLIVPVPLLLGAAVAIAVLTVAAAVMPIRAALQNAPIRAYLSA